MSVDRLGLARDALSRGDSTTARRLVAQVLIAEPANEQAWLLMARLATNREQVIDCLERALRINPDNPATRHALQAMARVRPAPPIATVPLAIKPLAAPANEALNAPAGRSEPHPAKPVTLLPVEEAPTPIRPPKRKRNYAMVIGSLIVFIIVVIAIIGPRVAPQDPMQEHAILQVEGKWYIPPFNAFQVPGYPLGSDQFGRDMLSRVLYAVRPTLVMISIVAVVRLVLGTLIGLGAGWSAGRLGRFLDGLISSALALPVLLVALGVITMLGTETGLVVFIAGLSINGWGETARLVRQQTQLIKGQLFIESARSQGASAIQILYRHILRQIMPMVWMLFAFEISGTLMVTGALGFLGYYIGGDVWIEVADFVSRRTSGTPELGQMLATSWVNLLQPWPLVLTGTVVFITILGFNLLGDGLRTRLELGFVNRHGWLSRQAERLGIWFEESVSYPALSWFRVNSIRPVLVSLAVVFLGGSLYFYQTRIAGRFNPNLAAITIPGGQIWAANRIDPYGTTYFNAIGPASSDVLWKVAHSAGFSGDPAVAANGTVYVAGSDGILFAFNPDGSLLWRKPLPANPVGPLALGSQGEIYVADAQNGLMAISPDGNILWTYATQVFGQPNHGPIVAPDGNIFYLLETPVGDTLVALSPTGQLLWSKKPGTYGATTGVRLSPDGTQLYVKDVVMNASDGAVLNITVPTQGNPLLGNQAFLFVGADGKSYLLAGHIAIRWTETSQRFNIVNSINWDYRSQGIYQSSGYPKDSGASPQGNVWLFYSGEYQETHIYWLNPAGDILGMASGPFTQDARLVAMDGDSTGYVCGRGFSKLQGYDATMCEAYRPNATTPLWSYLFPEGANGVVGAALAPGRMYVVTADGTLTALGSLSSMPPTTTPVP